MSRILVTGAAGFIGFHLCKRYLQRGDLVFGFDNVNDYYDVTLKNDRLSQLEDISGFTFGKLDIVDRDAVAKTIFKDSAALTRGSLAPWKIRSGFVIFCTWFKGDRDLSSSASLSGWPIFSNQSGSRAFQ